jgi:cell division protein YceG involved in septum cleavage
VNERQLRGAGLLVVSFLAVAFLVGAVWRMTMAGGYGSLRAETASERVASAEPVRRIVIPPGWRAEEVAGALQKAGISDGDAFLEDVRRRKLQGYLAPGVYEVDSDFSEEELVDEMAERFTDMVTPAMRRRARALGLSLREVVTLASIVQREMLRPSDAPVISAVFHNRLKIGMPLKSNPTNIFARESARGPIDGQYWRSRLDVRIDSPYNTYVRKGLPPGPIASPSDDAVKAALWPADVKHLFFVARGNGSHDFAFTGRVHVANVKRYERGLEAPKASSELQRFVDRLAPPGGHVGLVVKHLVTGETASVNADDFFTSASLYKLAVMLSAFEARERGRLDFTDRLPISERTSELDTPEVRGRLGRAPSIARAIREMIVVSSNAAGVTLLRKLGPDDVDRSLRRYGMRDTSVSSVRMVTTPRDVARLLELVATGRAVSKGASAEMVRILLRQEIRNRLPRHLPRNARLAHKTGDLERLSHDAGILYLRGGPVVIVAMTEEANRAQAKEAIGLLGRFVYDYYEA